MKPTDVFVFMLLISFCQTSVQFWDHVETDDILKFLDDENRHHAYVERKKANRTEQFQRKYFSDQLVDHFTGDEAGQWAQPYLVDFLHMENASSPVFLDIGGEWNIQLYEEAGKFGHVFTDDIAEKYKAVIFSLQHRYYAPDAYPTENTDNFTALLSSRQALADAAYFIKKVIRQQYQLTGKIIISGCSYGGSLAIWFQKKYPLLTTAAISLSPPLKAQLEFQEYLNYAASLAERLLPNCTEKIKIFKQKVVTQAATKPHYFIDKFGFCLNNSLNETEASELVNKSLNYISHIFLGFQYKSEFPVLKTTICPTLHLDPYLAVNHAVKKFLHSKKCDSITWNSTCIDARVLFDQSLAKKMCNKEIHNDTNYPWHWQKCSEFGYFKTVKENTSAGGLLPPEGLESLLDDCEDWFQLSPENVTTFVEQTNVLYGDDITDASKLLIVNGEYDPWKLLSLPPTSGVDFKGVTSVELEGEHHCPESPVHFNAAMKQWLL